MKSELLSERELRLFAQQIKLPAVGIKGQEKLKKARVLVIGAGGKGITVLQNLTTSGIGFIGISDNFFVEEANISRQTLYGDLAVGKQKAIIAKQKLSEIAYNVNFEVHNICLAKDNILRIFEGYDLIVDATDNFSAHYLINDAAIIKNITVVYGSVYHKYGMVTVFNHAGGPSFRCLFPTIPHHAENPDDEGMYGTGILYGITGSLMANEILSVILDQQVSLSGNLLTFNISDYSTKTERIVKKPDNFTITSLD